MAFLVRGGSSTINPHGLPYSGMNVHVNRHLPPRRRRKHHSVLEADRHRNRDPTRCRIAPHPRRFTGRPCVPHSLSLSPPTRQKNWRPVPGHRHHGIDADVVLFDVEELPLGRIVGHSETLGSPKIEVSEEIEICIECKVPQAPPSRTLVEWQTRIHEWPPRNTIVLGSHGHNDTGAAGFQCLRREASWSLSVGSLSPRCLPCVNRCIGRHARSRSKGREYPMSGTRCARCSAKRRKPPITKKAIVTSPTVDRQKPLGLETTSWEVSAASRSGCEFAWLLIDDYLLLTFRCILGGGSLFAIGCSCLSFGIPIPSRSASDR